MKKLASTVFAACFGGVVAITGTHLVFDNDKATESQVTNPEMAPIYKLTNLKNGTSAGNFADFTMAAERSVNSVVHIKTVSEHVNNLAYDPFAELFFGPQKRQHSYIQQGMGSGVIISED